MAAVVFMMSVGVFRSQSVFQKPVRDKYNVTDTWLGFQNTGVFMASQLLSALTHTRHSFLLSPLRSATSPAFVTAWFSLFYFCRHFIFKSFIMSTDHNRTIQYKLRISIFSTAIKLSLESVYTLS